MNVYVHTDDGYPSEHRDRVIAKLREKHPGARIQRLDAGKADRILCFATGDLPSYVRWFLKTGTPTVHYRPDTPPDVYDERLFEATLVAELDAVEVVHDTRMRHGARRMFDERRNTSGVFPASTGAADEAVAASKAWRAAQKAAEKTEPEHDQLSLGATLRDEGIERADRAADADWKSAAEDALWTTLAWKDEFTTDDLWKALDEVGVERPREPRAIAGVLQRARSNGVIEPTDTFVSSTRPEHHAGPIRVWRKIAAPTNRAA